MEIPIDLKNAICNNKLIVFAGAGLSYNLLNAQNQPLKGWSNLVEHILLFLKESGYGKAGNLLPLINDYDPVEVLRLIETNEKFPKTEIYNFLKEFLDIENDKNNLSLHEKICELSNKVITTNYDVAFETAKPNLRKYRAYKGKNYELTKHKDPNSKLLFKLHGCYEDSDSMVLFPSNYKDLYDNEARDAEHSLFVLKNIIANNSLLFIGTGMSDFQINTIFKEIKNLQGEYNQKHFIITNKTLDSSLDFLTPISITNHTKIEGVIEKLLSLKESCQNEDTEKVKELEDQLKQATERIKELENKSSPNKDDLLEEEALKYFSEGLEFSLIEDYEDAIQKYKRSTELKENFHEAFNNWGTDLGNLAETKQGKEKEALYNLAFEKFDKAIQIKPDKHEAFNNWGTYLGNLAKTKQGKEKEALYTLAFEKFDKAIQIKPDYHEAFYNWGTYLGNLAKTKQGKEKEEVLNLAFQKFDKAIQIKPDYHQAFNNWGNCIGNLAETKQGKEKEEILNLAFQKFDKAIQIKPDKHEAFNNWGTYLGNLAETKQGKEKEDLYTLAFEKFDKAIQIKPDYHEAFYNWGTYLGNLAETKQGKEKEDLYALAFEKFDKAIQIKPDKHEAFNNWGNCIGNLAKTKQGKEKEALYTLAFEKLESCVNYGGSSYNLSCLYALQGKKKEALHHLKNSLENKNIETSFVLKDDDWENYLEDVDFLEIINQFK